jgi:lipoprotein-anchoring transpeptidase ErfK/SrfK
MSRLFRSAAALAVVAAASFATSASANPLSLFPFPFAPQDSQPAVQAPESYGTNQSYGMDQGYGADRSYGIDGVDESSVLPPRFRRQIVSYRTSEAPGTIVIDTPHTYLYYVLGNGRAIRYGIGVGREGFTWSGVQTITKKAEWPDWTPPPEMIARQPYLPRYMAGGPGNPLGARAMYLGNTMYRIHGTNAPETIGRHVSSGCIRMLNADAIDLFNRVHIGTKVVVLPMTARSASIH